MTDELRVQIVMMQDCIVAEWLYTAEPVVKLKIATLCRSHLTEDAYTVEVYSAPLLESQ